MQPLCSGARSSRPAARIGRHGSQAVRRRRGGSSLRPLAPSRALVEDDPKDFPHGPDERPKTVFSLLIRDRVRDTTRQVHGVIVQRIKDANRPQDTATPHGFTLEVREIAKARAEGTPGDVRAAYVAVATSAILLAEQADRPAEPKRGSVRAGRDQRASRPSWHDEDYSIPGAA